MSNVAVLGNLFGDEGKARIVHYLAKDYDWVIRFNGGANAGHTIYRDGKKFVHNLLPSFDWRIPKQKCFLSQGMVIDLKKLFEEVSQAELDYFSVTGSNNSVASRVYVDPDAFVVLPKHIEEDKAKNGHIGSTNRGIGPAYKDKVNRSGKRVKDLLNEKDEYALKLKEIGVQFKHVLSLKPELEKSNLLFEGAQGVMIDLNHGTYPYVSCSDATVSGIYSSGFAWMKLDKVYGVTKSYMTKVGEGPFPTEVFGEEAEYLRKLGEEYGATTGRPRRIGWLDLPMLNYACQKAGITDLIVTKMDILDGMDKVKVCDKYDEVPVSPSDFFNAKPQYIGLPGWENSKSLDTRPFLQHVSSSVKTPISMISCGVNDSDIIYL